jgi:hypothetical protein
VDVNEIVSYCLGVLVFGEKRRRGRENLGAREAARMNEFGFGLCNGFGEVAFWKLVEMTDICLGMESCSGWIGISMAELT